MGYVSDHGMIARAAQDGVYTRFRRTFSDVFDFALVTETLGKAPLGCRFGIHGLTIRSRGGGRKGWRNGLQFDERVHRGGIGKV